MADDDILPIRHINERVGSDSGEMRTTLSSFSVLRDDA